LEGDLDVRSRKTYLYMGELKAINRGKGLPVQAPDIEKKRMKSILP